MSRKMRRRRLNAFWTACSCEVHLRETRKRHAFPRFPGLGSACCWRSPRRLRRAHGDGETLDRILPDIRAAHPGRLSDAEPWTDDDGRTHYRIKWMTPEGPHPLLRRRRAHRPLLEFGWRRRRSDGCRAGDHRARDDNGGARPPRDDNGRRVRRMTTWPAIATNWQRRRRLVATATGGDGAARLARDSGDGDWRGNGDARGGDWRGGRDAGDNGGWHHHRAELIMRILLVEDDKDLQRLLKKALIDAGYVVDTAGDGEEGHFLGDTEPYDAVILDLGLPKMDGVRVLEKWRKDGRTMPVLILTARDRWSDKVAGFDAGADDYLAKPFYHRGIAGARARAAAPRRRPCHRPRSRSVPCASTRAPAASRSTAIRSS